MRNPANEIVRNIGLANEHPTKELRADLLTCFAIPRLPHPWAQ